MFFMSVLRLIVLEFLLFQARSCIENGNLFQNSTMGTNSNQIATLLFERNRNFSSENSQDQFCMGNLFQSSTMGTNSNQIATLLFEHNQNFSSEHYEGGIEVPCDFGTVSVLHKNDNGQTSLCILSDKEALNSGNEDCVCIFSNFCELGTIQYVRCQATSNRVLQNMIWKVDLEGLIDKSQF